MDQADQLKLFEARVVQLTCSLARFGTVYLRLIIQSCNVISLNQFGGTKDLLQQVSKSKLSFLAIQETN